MPIRSSRRHVEYTIINQHKEKNPVKALRSCRVTGYFKHLKSHMPRNLLVAGKMEWLVLWIGENKSAVIWKKCFR